MESETSSYEKLIIQCKSNDVDVKVEALTKLQAQFERGGLEISDSEALVNILKSSLRTSNLHLTNATLSALPIILPALISKPVSSLQSSNNALAASSSTSSASPSNFIDATTLRLALGSFLQSGGVIDRLGDKEKAQIKAREALVILGGYAFRFGGGSTISSKSGKGVEPPILVFEKYLKEGGLASKVWKVREQSILTLIHIRRAHHLFPIRPYLTLLVDCLEDTDPHVRDCARQSVVELFSGPGVSDAARADLKKEMTKKGVRKTIVDSVLSKLLGSSIAGNNPQSREGSENGDVPNGKKEYVPPSLTLQGKRPGAATQNSNGMSRTLSQSLSKELSRPASRADVVSPPLQTPTTESPEIRPIASSRDLETEFASMLKPFEGKETEHNWAAREQAIQRVRGMLKGEVHLRFSEPFLAVLKDGFIQWSTKTLASLRTTVAVNTCLLYNELALALGHHLDPHCEVLLTNLLKMGGFTKKITAQQSQASAATIMSNTSPQPRLVIPLLGQTLQEKTVQARAFGVGHLKLYLEMHGHRFKNSTDASSSVEILEKSLKKALADANPAVKESARSLFWVFEDIWSDRGQAVMESLDTTARKQLEKACPHPDQQTTLPPTTPKITKKSSVAAAIAASRAKAKAIATAPPSLRHQATSASHSTMPRRAGSPGTSPRSSVIHPVSLQRASSSSPSSPRRVVSASLARSTNSAFEHNTFHSRTTPNNSDNGQRSTSPSLSDQGTRRRLSSPLTSTSSTMHKALSTLLPTPSPAIRSSPLLTDGTSRAGESFSHVFGHHDEDLLMAQTVPIPDDTDSEDESSLNLMSFSAPLEIYPPINLALKSNKSTTVSPVSRPPRGSVSNALSSGSISDLATSQQPVVEDALRARAEQAECAAERLLELVEPDDEPSVYHSPIPPLLSKISSGLGQATSKAKARPIPIPVPQAKPSPKTPNNRATTIMRQAALFSDSPVQNVKSPSLMDVLQNRKQDTGWWLKRKILFSHVTPSRSPDIKELDNLISQLDRGDVDVAALKRLAIICMESAVLEASSPSMSSKSHPSSPTPLVPSGSIPALHLNLWEKNKRFDRFFDALIKSLEQTKTEEELAYGLVVVWEVLEGQSMYLEGKEGDLFSLLLRVRYCNKLDVLEGTNAICDRLTSRIDPVYGLTTVHASLKGFYSEAPPTPESEEIKAASYAFGLMALGKFILRLPAEIAEEELPRLKTTLINSLNDRSSLIVRESAAASIIAAQLVLHDETHLFALLDGLSDEKKNLLTYLFDKHSARGTEASVGQIGIEKLEKEMRRLDTRTSTPLRGRTTL